MNINFFVKNKKRGIFLVFLLFLPLLAFPIVKLQAEHNGTSHEPDPTTEQPPSDGRVPGNDSYLQGPPAPTGNGNTGGGTEEAGKGSNETCISFTKFDPKTCVVQFASWIFFIVHGAMGFFLWVASKIFNLIIAVQNTAFHNQAVVNLGWIIARDVVNIFFILVLLVIAISTILGIGGYQAKQLLANILISALLVNFSLAITGLVIDATTVLGNTFYQKMGNENDPYLQGTVRQKDGTVINARDISGKLVDAFAPQQALVKNPNYEFKGTFEVMVDIIIAFIFGIILIAIATFVILAASILLLIRIIALWFVMILSPFAFLFFVLPHTKSYAGQWSSALITYALFYPAYMFMLYLVFVMIDNNAIAALFGTELDITSLTKEGSAGISSFASRANQVLGFILLAAMMVGSLIVAQKMGVYGAGTIAAYGKKKANAVKKSIAGGANRLGWRAATSQYIGGGVGNAAITNTLGRVPLASRAVGVAIQKGEQARQYQAKQEAKRASGVDPKSQAKIMATLSAKGQMEVYKKLGEKEKRDMAKNMGELVGTRQVNIMGHNLNKNGISKEESAAFIARGAGVEEAMRFYANMDEHDYAPRMDGVEDSPASKAYYKKLEDLMRALTPEQRSGIYEKDLAHNPYLQDYFIRNSKINKKDGSNDFSKEFTKSRSDIERGNAFLQKIYERLGARNSPEMVDMMKREYGPSNPMINIIAGSPGVKMLLDPGSIAVQEKKEKEDKEAGEIEKLKNEITGLKEKSESSSGETTT